MSAYDPAGRYEAVIGLECHVQLLTAGKLFSTAEARFGGEPNTHVDPYTLGLPGTLPVLNQRAVEFALRLGLAAGCRIRPRSRFARKHYFYPDLPKGYQISQYEEPLCEGGQIEFLLHGERRAVRLVRIHMEEDAGKNIHDQYGGGRSLVDYNRAGVPLVEIVSEPEIRSAEEAGEYLRAVRGLVRALGISDGNMEEGSLRCDANVSIRPRGQGALGTKTELKNINSIRFVRAAIEHEIARQIELVEGGGRVVQETRGWDAERGTSRSQRSKEEAHDYRYLPDPDLPEIVVDDAWLAAVRAALPEAPLLRRVRYLALGLSPGDATLFSSEHELGDYFDETLTALSPGRDPRAAARLAAGWIGTELLSRLHGEGVAIARSPLPPPLLAELMELIDEGQISGKMGKQLFPEVYGGASPRALVRERGLAVVADPAAIEALCRRVLDDPKNEKLIERYRAGQDKVLGSFVGQVMKESGGQAKPELVNETLRRLLQGQG